MEEYQQKIETIKKDNLIEIKTNKETLPELIKTDFTFKSEERKKLEEKCAFY